MIEICWIDLPLHLRTFLRGVMAPSASAFASITHQIGLEALRERCVVLLILLTVFWIERNRAPSVQIAVVILPLCNAALIQLIVQLAEVVELLQYSAALIKMVPPRRPANLQFGAQLLILKRQLLRLDVALDQLVVELGNLQFHELDFLRLDLQASLRQPQLILIVPVQAVHLKLKLLGRLWLLIATIGGTIRNELILEVVFGSVIVALGQSVVPLAAVPHEYSHLLIFL